MDVSTNVKIVETQFSTEELQLADKEVTGQNWSKL